MKRELMTFDNGRVIDIRPARPPMIPALPAPESTVAPSLEREPEAAVSKSAMADVVRFAAAPLHLFAGPFECLTRLPGHFGNLLTGAWTWVGAFVAFPLFAGELPVSDLLAGRWYAGDDALFRLPAWGALNFLVLLQMLAAWCREEPRVEGERDSWFGPAEPMLAALIIFPAWTLHGAGTGTFFFLGFTCSRLHDWCMGLAKRCERWTPEDTEWAMTPVRVYSRWREARRARKAQAAPPVHVFAPGGPLLPALQGLPEGSPVIVFAPQSAPVPRQSASGWFARSMFTHFVFYILTSGMALSFIVLPLAGILWLFGWKPEPPESVKGTIRAVTNILRFFDGHKDAVVVDPKVERGDDGAEAETGNDEDPGADEKPADDTESEAPPVARRKGGMSRKAGEWVTNHQGQIDRAKAKAKDKASQILRGAGAEFRKGVTGGF